MLLLVTILITVGRALGLVILPLAGPFQSGGNVTLEWTSNASNDPPRFILELYSPTFNSRDVLAKNVDMYSDKMTAQLPDLPPSNDYILWFARRCRYNPSVTYYQPPSPSSAPNVPNFPNVPNVPNIASHNSACNRHSRSLTDIPATFADQSWPGNFTVAPNVAVEPVITVAPDVAVEPVLTVSPDVPVEPVIQKRSQLHQ
ncbi:hypothetical protein B0H19DRAFT_1258660 [Mycena capillaripes]|nr:hypothetical protein B0H19DRAFT_1258660 [Mycena capillaripes]